MSTVELFDRSRRASSLGIKNAESLVLDWPTIISRKRSIVESWSKGKEPALREAGIDVILGPARFVSPHEIEVDSRRISAGRFVIATGSKASRPASIDGIEHAMISDDLLDHPEVPARVVIVGGGVIALELGFCFARAGSTVTVLQNGPHILPSADEEMRDALVEIGRSLGMKFHTNITVKRIRPDRTAEGEKEGSVDSFPADIVLLAAGRPPNTAHLSLEAVGVERTQRGGVAVNEFLQSTSASHVYAAGDAVGRFQHTPTAWYEGPIAARNALQGNSEKTDYSVLPTTVFTIPALAQVGMTERQAIESGCKVKINRTLVKHNPAAGIREEMEGLTKLIYEEGSEKLLGIHILGPHAEDLIGGAAVALRCGLTRRELAGIHPVFPTLGSAIIDAANGW